MMNYTEFSDIKPMKDFAILEYSSWDLVLVIYIVLDFYSYIHKK